MDYSGFSWIHNILKLRLYAIVLFVGCSLIDNRGLLSGPLHSHVSCAFDCPGGIVEAPGSF